MTNSRRIKLIILSLLALILIVGIWQFSSYWSHRGLAKINIVVLPPDSQLQVDGNATKPGKVYVKPGVHKLSASREFFQTVERQINTNNVKPDEIIYLLPKPVSAEAKQWLIDHPDVQRQRESVGGEEAIKQQAELTTGYPILEKLPHENSHYRIDYSLDSNNKPEFMVNMFGSVKGPNDYPRYLKQLRQYKQEAIKFLQDNGVNLQDFKVTYSPAI